MISLVVSLPEKHCSTLSIGLLHPSCNAVWSISSAIRCLWQPVCASCWTVTIGPRAFAVACPKSWNSLPQDLRVPGITQGEFRNRLKTVLFEEMLSGRL